MIYFANELKHIKTRFLKADLQIFFVVSITKLLLSGTFWKIFLSSHLVYLICIPFSTKINKKKSKIESKTSIILQMANISFQENELQSKRKFIHVNKKTFIFYPACNTYHRLCSRMENLNRSIPTFKDYFLAKHLIPSDHHQWSLKVIEGNEKFNVWKKYRN